MPGYVIIYMPEGYEVNFAKYSRMLVPHLLYPLEEQSRAFWQSIGINIHSSPLRKQGVHFSRIFRAELQFHAASS